MWSYPKCWEAQSWLLTTNTVSCFPFRNRLTLLTVEKMTAQYTQVRVPTFCQLLFQEKMVVHEKAASAACNSITQVPFFQAPIVLHSAAAECFLCTSHSVTKNIKMTWTQGSRFNKVVIPIARFLKGFLEGNWCAIFFFFFHFLLLMCGEEECRDYQAHLLPLPWLALRRQPFPHNYFCTMSANVSTVKRQIMSLCYSKNSFDLREGRGDSPESTNHTLRATMGDD